MVQLTGGRESFDAGGKHAVQGRCIEPLLQRWLTHPFFHRRPPRSLPRHSFGTEFAAQAIEQAREASCSLHDLLCTATHFVAQSIGESLRRFSFPGQPPDRLLLTGGGTRNGLLWRLLEQQFPGLPLDRTDPYGVPADVCKAASTAVLTALMMDGVPANVPSTTGAAGSRLLGSLTPGTPANWARCLAWMALQTAPLAVAV